MAGYAELAVTTNFSFLRGGSHPEELVARAAALGLSGLGIADRNSVAGTVRAHVAAKEAGLRLAVGCRLVFADATPEVLAYPSDRAAWGRLCRLLTLGNRRAAKGECRLGLDDLLAHAQGLCLALVAPRGIEARFARPLARLAEAAPGRVWLAAAMLYRGDDRRRLLRLAEMAAAARVPLLATGDVLYHVPERRPLQDVVTCIREHVSLDAAGFRLEANAERHLKGAGEMARLFRDCPQAVAETAALLDRLGFSLDDLRYEYPDEVREGYASPQAALAALTGEGAARRYPQGVPEKVRALLGHELGIIDALGYAPYFLTVHDIVRFARARGILCQGRGSAANSAVCFCLGITEVDPGRMDLLFERFVSAERREPPDIDVDFEHERREEVIQYIYARYGRERAGLAATLITYRSRSALREVGKAFGLTDDTVAALSGLVWGWSSEGVAETEVRRIGLDPADARLAKALALARELIGFPRHLSQHVGGFVIARGRLDEVVPIGNAAMPERTVIEWDKDDIDALGILKIDVLGLGMLTCLRKAFSLLDAHYGRRLSLAAIPAEDEAVYRMLCRADSLGVFQVESRAQMSMLPRLKPARFYDLVIEVAIVRPGPIQGDMVHPYLRRRQGLEPVAFPSAELEAVLGKTLGVPLFQEQAMRIAIVAAGFTPTEADKLRRAMATFRRVGTIGTFQRKMVEGMAARGYAAEFAERCFRQIEGFGEYGFPESHAASFALLVYASAWLKCHYPDAFACALLNAQPMGFYAPAQIVRDAEEHGVEVRAVDVNFSCWDHTLECIEPPQAPHPAAAGAVSDLPIPRAQKAGITGQDGSILITDLWPLNPDRGGRAAQAARVGVPLGAAVHPRHRDMAADICSTHALRLGLRQISGLAEADAGQLVAARAPSRFASLRDLWLRSGLSPAVLARLAEADAFRSLGLDRRQALWAVQALGRAGDQDRLPLFAAPGGRPREPQVALPAMALGEHVVEDYRRLHLSLKAHPLAFLREELARRNVLPNGALAAATPGRRVTVAGLVLVRQRPGSANGVIFATLEDETAVANVIVWPKVFERFRPQVLGGRLLAVTGRLQSEAGVIHVVAERVQDLTALLASLSADAPPVDAAMRPDEARRPPGEDARTARAAMPKGRNFH